MNAALCARARGCDKRTKQRGSCSSGQPQGAVTEDPAYVTSGQPAQMKHIQLVAPPIYLQAASEEVQSTVPDEGGPSNETTLGNSVLDRYR